MNALARWIPGSLLLLTGAWPLAHHRFDLPIGGVAVVAAHATTHLAFAALANPGLGA